MLVYLPEAFVMWRFITSAIVIIYSSTCVYCQACDLNPCPGGSICTAINNTYTCACAGRFYSDSCQIYNACSDNPSCAQCGTFTSPVAYQCDCSEGYSGNTCQSNTICSYNDPCPVGYSCTQSTNSPNNKFKCSCPVGFIGDNCEIYNTCYYSNTCPQGSTCTWYTNPTRYTCSCPDGYSGDGCNTFGCTSNPCATGYTCTSSTNPDAYICTCPTGYSGSSCSIYNGCTSNLCPTGYICTSYTNPDTYTCDCLTGYSGDDCSMYNGCTSDPCPRAYICTSYTDPDTYNCTCPTGYSGDDCITYDGCMSNPCSTGYICTSYTNPDTYNCRCPTGYSGNDCSKYDENPSQPTENPASGTDLVIIVVAVVVVFIIVIIVVIVILKKRRKNRDDQMKNVIKVPVLAIDNPLVHAKPEIKREREQSNVNKHDGKVEEVQEVELEMVKKGESSMQEFVLPPILLSDLSEYVRTRKETGQLRIEWKSFPENLTLGLPATAAQLKCNLKKNRYKNVIPYDHSRIVLRTNLNDSKPGSDYINACYMPGYKDKQQFIAAQGPNATTLEDFWKLVWQENVHMIVMLTNLVEIGKTKCVQYWPDAFSTLYGDIAVTFTNVVEQSSYIKTFNVYKANSPKRNIHLLHYKTWPDKNVPQNTQDVSKFIKEMNTLYTAQCEGPILVHCSAGAGRTGAFIAICAMFDMAKQEQCVDIHNFVKEMRSRRPNMVQTSDQYIFIYETVLDESLCGNTLIHAMKFRTQFERLQIQNPDTGRSQINVQFELLDSLSPVFTFNQKRVSLSEENFLKNRYEEKVPVTLNRPMLAGGDKMSDYINASFFDSALKRDAFIATQAPLEHTMDDFWRLVFDYECCNIVSLTDPATEGFVPYWSDQTLALPNTIVDYVSDEVYTSNVTVWNMTVGKLSDKSNVGSKQSVKIFQFHAWPSDSDVPTSCRALLDLVSAVLKAQGPYENKPILIQCMDGVGRSGTFCATLSCIQTLKQIQTVDVFQAVRVLRRNRTGMVETQAQYEFIYATILEQLSAFDIYENVKHTYEGEYENHAFVE